MSAGAERPANRPRGRPRNDGTRPPLTRDAIADAALAIVAEQGFPSLTMRALADALNVTVRALYRHVTDRQDVINLVAARIIALQPEHAFDPEDWRASVRSLYRETRRTYRRIGRAVLFAFEETIGPTHIPDGRILLPEHLLASLTALGLSLDDALIWRQQFLTDVFGFALLIDYLHDHGSDEERHEMLRPVPKTWLDAHPDTHAPLARQALLRSPPSTDAAFERMIERAILAIEVGRTSRSEFKE